MEVDGGKSSVWAYLLFHLDNMINDIRFIDIIIYTYISHFTFACY